MPPSPGCEAVTVQVPTLTKLAVVLETVQTLGVVELKLTGNPELAVAVSERGVPTVWDDMAGKVMV